jgi:hypothetical protein
MPVRPVSARCGRQGRPIIRSRIQAILHRDAAPARRTGAHPRSAGLDVAVGRRGMAVSVFCRRRSDRHAHPLPTLGLRGAATSHKGRTAGSRPAERPFCPTAFASLPTNQSVRVDSQRQALDRPQPGRTRAAREPEVRGLVALMEIQLSRFETRSGPFGDLCSCSTRPAQLGPACNPAAALPHSIVPRCGLDR